MSFTEIVDLCSDDEHADVYVKAVKSEPGFAYDAMRQKEYQKTNFAPHVKSKIQSPKQESEDRGSGTLTATHSSISMLEQGPPLFDDTDLSSSSSLCPAPLCRKFWNAGNYEDRLGSKITPQSGKNYLHVHPMFLHSNATSHKWAFGAVAELLDNAVDEIQNGATFVIVDKISNPRDGSTALLIHDDGGGMDPEAMRRCMSFGFSDKKSKSAIGQSFQMVMALRLVQ